uniref:Uncharacterized protein n=1 Tax=Plectus sambesii TaxID=2011161 RepID=A0A914XJM6_9BILA
MDGFTWLLLSWLAVGAFCYFVLQKLGATDSTASPTAPGSGAEKTATVTSTTTTYAQYSDDGPSLVHRPSPGVRHDYSNHQPPRLNIDTSFGSHSGGAGHDKWVNDFIAWLFNNYKGAPEAANAWLRSLNDASKKVTAPTSCEVLFESFGDHSTVHDAPKLRNIRVEPGPRDHLTFRSEVTVPEVRLKLVSSQRLHDRLLVSNYDA